MSHHFDSAADRADGRINLCDLYVFPRAPGTTVLILTVNPHAGCSSGTTFRPNAVYEFVLASDAGAVEDIAFWVWEAGDDKSFGGITGTWMGVAGAATMMQAMVQGSYNPGYIYRNYTFTFNQGSAVYLLDAPDGEVLVMQSFTPHWDPTLSVDDLAHLASRLGLPRGWGFRAEILDWDLEVSSAMHDNLAHVMQDNLHNVYQGSDVGRAFTHLCPEDSRW